jgi:hypothetical protein
MSTSQPLDAYLRGHGFTPAPGHATWLDHPTADGMTIRVVCEPEEETQLIALAPHSVCLYKAMFYAGTPDAVIIAAVQAALRLPPDAASQPPQAAPGRGTATRDTSRRVPARRKESRDDHR